MTRRTERIAEQLRGEIARVLREEASDPRVELVTLTRVDVAPDLSNAVVFWSAMVVKGGATPEEIQDGLDSAAGFVRKHLARELPLRRMPELRFRHDPSLALGSETLNLLRTLDAGSGGQKSNTAKAAIPAVSGSRRAKPHGRP